jgi:putative glutamine amidotransferase
VSRPLVGLTIGPENAESRYLRLRGTYPAAIEAAGGVPVLIPPLFGADALRELLQRLDALVFPGGVDVDPAFYEEAQLPETKVNPDLDRLELAVAHWAAANSVPTLGICRGQQLLNVALGGSLIQHLEGHKQDGARSAPHHGLRVDPASRLATILGAPEVQVNSHHHQAVKRLGRCLRAVAWAPDGTIEALESTEHPWLVAVQFHPEDMVPAHLPSQRLFEALIEAARTPASVHPPRELSARTSIVKTSRSARRPARP